MLNKTKVSTIFGTRPEAIKLAPLILELKKNDSINLSVCVTGQHTDMIYPILDFFGIKPDHDFKIMKKNQTLFDISISALQKLEHYYDVVKPELVIVHGDTTTSFIAGLAAFYKNIKIAHVEAGLRTMNKLSPFPEEFNRQALSIVADYHFCPTEKNKDILVGEGKIKENIYVTGNTVIDALKYTVGGHINLGLENWIGDSKLILLTSHRRENIGTAMTNIFQAVKYILIKYPNIKVVYPIHRNTRVRNIANTVFGSISNLKIIEPLGVLEFHNLMAKSFLILTDSGGIQEEGPALNIPVIVLRDSTERTEGLDAGTLKLAGTSYASIVSEIDKFLMDQNYYNKVSKSINPYGDGKASKKIVEILNNILFRSEHA